MSAIIDPRLADVMTAIDAKIDDVITGTSGNMATGTTEFVDVWGIMRRKSGTTGTATIVKRNGWCVFSGTINVSSISPGSDVNGGWGTVSGNSSTLFDSLPVGFRPPCSVVGIFDKRGNSNQTATGQITVSATGNTVVHWADSFPPSGTGTVFNVRFQVIYPVAN